MVSAAVLDWSDSGFDCPRCGTHRGRQISETPCLRPLEAREFEFEKKELVARIQVKARGLRVRKRELCAQKTQDKVVQCLTV